MRGWRSTSSHYTEVENYHTSAPTPCALSIIQPPIACLCKSQSHHFVVVQVFQHCVAQSPSGYLQRIRNTDVYDRRALVSRIYTYADRSETPEHCIDATICRCSNCHVAQSSINTARVSRCAAIAALHGACRAAPQWIVRRSASIRTRKCAENARRSPRPSRPTCARRWACSTR